LKNVLLALAILLTGQRSSAHQPAEFIQSQFKFILSGDFDGDGKTDIAGLANDFTWHISTRGDSAMDLLYNADVWGKMQPDNWIDAQVGDFDGDGTDDLLAYRVPFGNQFGYLTVLLSDPKAEEGKRLGYATWRRTDARFSYRFEISDVYDCFRKKHRRDGLADLIGTNVESGKSFSMCSSGKSFEAIAEN